VQALVTFFVLTYVVSWTLFAAGAAIAKGSASIFAGPLFLIGTFAPSLVALALTFRASGRTGTLALLRRVGKWPRSLGWYVFAVGYIAAIKLTAALLHRFVAGAWPRFGSESWYLMAVAVVLSTPVQAGEEIGWRGYALPRLANRVGLGRGSVVLGLIWACWHLPLFFIPVGDTFGQSFPLYLLQVTAMSVAVAWLYWRTEGSLFITMLLHASANNTKDIVPSSVPGATNPLALSTSLVAWLSVGLLWICAAYFFVRMRGGEFHKGSQAGYHAGS
jgi:membrane protease YdiL (CAAX protease family)